MIFTAETLKRFSESTGTGLQFRRTFASCATAQVAAKIVQCLNLLGAVPPSHHHVGRGQRTVNGSQFRHDACDRTDQPIETRQRLRW